MVDEKVDTNIIEKQKEFQKIIYQTELLNKQQEYIQTQVTILNEIIKQTNISIENINGLKTLKNKEVIIPIGEGVFVRAKIVSNNVLYNIGEKIFIEKDYNEVEKALRENVAKFTKALEDINKKGEEIEKMMEQLNIQGKKIAGELQSKQKL